MVSVLNKENFLKDAENAVRDMERRFKSLFGKVVSAVSEEQLNFPEQSGDALPVKTKSRNDSESSQPSPKSKKPDRCTSLQNATHNESNNCKSHLRCQSVEDQRSSKRVITQRSISRIEMKTPKWEVKLKVSQPYKLRKPEHNKKIFGFGSFLKADTAEKKLSNPKPLNRPLFWRTDMRCKNRKLRVPKPKVSESEMKPLRKKSMRSITTTARSVHRCPSQSELMPIQDITLVPFTQGKSMPFVACCSTSRSFNLLLNVQEVLSRIKGGKRNNGAKEICFDGATNRSSCFSECPAMAQPPLESFNPNDMWSAPCISARCICFPPQQYPQPKFQTSRSSDWRKSDPNLGMLEECVDGIKKDWSILNRKIRTSMNKRRGKSEIQHLEYRLKERFGYYKEIEGTIIEAKKMKSELLSWKEAQDRKPPAQEFTKVLRRIHSSL